MWDRVELKMRGKMAFKKNYWSCVAVGFIMSIIAGISAGGSGNSGARQSLSQNDAYAYSQHSSELTMVLAVVAAIMAIIGIVMLLLYIFVGNVLTVGGCQFFVQNQMQQERVGVIFAPFRSGHYWNIVKVMFLQQLFIILWTFLLIIPGIIKSYEYRMIPYILSENPGMDRKEAFAISKRMMAGKKWAAFVLDLSFIGWWLLSGFTCGILSIFYVVPYKQATDAEMYTANRMLAFQEGYIR